VTEGRTTEIGLRWQPSARQRRLFTLAAIALFAALACRRSLLVLLAVPPVWLLLRPHLRGPVGQRAKAADSIFVFSTAIPPRCLEGELVEVRVRIHSDVALDQLEVQFVPGETVALDSRPGCITFVPVADHVEASWSVRAARWGHRPAGRIEVRASARGQLFAAAGQAELSELSVFPHHPPLAVLRTPAWLPDRVGDHVSRLTGEGIEFFDVRDYRVGDRPRRINWRATARRGSLQANRMAAERACDVVVVLDAFSDVGGAAHSSLDVAVRGVVATATAYLDRHDRVGLVVLGGALTWLRPDIGSRQFYRVVEAVLDARRAHAADRPALSAVPPVVLPPGALAVLFSPLLDSRAVEAVHALRARGVTPVVVDVRTCEPSAEPDIANADLALRLWRVEHKLDIEGFRRSGVPIVGWDGSHPLDVAFSQLPNRMRSA
jgi:uncharacterized protein (DUF58 family)